MTGVIVISKLGLDQFDADDLRLLEVLAGHASVALENARLYEAQRREAETAKALLALSRDLAEANGIADVAERVATGAADILASTSTSVWLQDTVDGSLERLAGFPEEERDEATALTRIPVEHLEPWLGRREPYSVDPTDYAGIARVPEGMEGRFAIAPFVVDGRWGVVAAAIAAKSAPERPRARASGQHRAPDPARAADRGELRKSRAHVPLHGRGSGQCARSERRVHVVTRPLDHRPRAASR